ncbi:MAG: hypothetical protein NTV22_01450 [bacterium]|nr:hypothetical protein [bacterium]
MSFSPLNYSSSKQQQATIEQHPGLSEREAQIDLPRVLNRDTAVDDLITFVCNKLCHEQVQLQVPFVRFLDYTLEEASERAFFCLSCPDPTKNPLYIHPWLSSFLKCIDCLLLIWCDRIPIEIPPKLELNTATGMKESKFYESAVYYELKKQHGNSLLVNIGKSAQKLYRTRNDLEHVQQGDQQRGSKRKIQHVPHVLKQKLFRNSFPELRTLTSGIISLFSGTT